jgi:ubiquinone/menaquinone biosynthesis C-methylase UbiE
MEKSERYVHAVTFDWLTPLYDPLVRWLMPESKIKNHLVQKSAIPRESRVLDVGCGTGTLAVLLKKAHPNAQVVGIDGDSKILEIARRKALKNRVEINLDNGMAFQLPYTDSSFQRVFSSFVLHHLTEENKQRTLVEMRRVMTPDGEVHIADFKRANKSLPGMLRAAGFTEVEEYANYWTIFSSVSLWRAA